MAGNNKDLYSYITFRMLHLTLLCLLSSPLLPPGWRRGQWHVLLLTPCGRRVGPPRVAGKWVIVLYLFLYNGIKLIYI